MDLAINPATESTSDEVLNTRSQTVLAGLINDSWGQGASHYVGCGKLLGEANDELPRLSFNSMVKTKLNFDASVARKLMCIAANPILCAHVHKLPPSWSIGYELSKLDYSLLDDALADGRIHPGMKRKDAIALRPTKETATETTPAETSAPVNSTPELSDAWGDASADQRRAFLDKLGHEGLCAAMSSALAASLRDHVLNLNIGDASESTDFAVYATNMLHSALACADTPTDENLKRVAALLNCINKKAKAKGVLCSAVVIAESKKISRVPRGTRSTPGRAASGKAGRAGA